MTPVFAPNQLVSGRYRILRFVACGGMGEVYEAEDLDLNERVALKTLLPPIAEDTGMVARFKQEIQLSRKIAHPNVCRVFDLARDPADGSASCSSIFLTMEFLDGETLATRLHREGPLLPAGALPLLEQMAQGLDAAHRAGIIHRDLKPSNVMLAPQAIITDFGLARRLSESTDSTATLSQNLIGTLDYMAPELLAGQSATIASDVYALGMVAYNMVTGLLPFAGKPPLAAAILRSQVPVPAPRSLVPGLDPTWDCAILRALDLEPARRFASAGAFVRALREEPSLTRRRWIGGGVAAAALVGGGVIWRTVNHFRSQLPVEAFNFYRLGVNDIHAGAYFAATKALDQAVRQTPRFSLAHARLAEAWNELDLIEKAGQEMLLARRGDLSDLTAAERLQVEAIDLTITREFEPAAAKYEQMRRYFKPDDTAFHLDLGRAYEKAGQPLKALENYRHAAEGTSRDPAAWLRLAVLYSRSADATKAAEAFGEADALYQLTSNLEGLTEVDLQRGTSANDRGRLDEAAVYLKKGVQAARAAGNTHQEIAAKLQLGTNAYLAGDAAACEQYAQEAIATAQANGMQALAARGIVGLGNAYFRKGDFGGAEKYYQNGLTLARHNDSRSLEAFALLRLSSVHNQLGRSDDSGREAQEALGFYQANHFARESLQCLTLLGRAQSARGNYAGATHSFRQALETAEKVQDHFQMALAHESMGGVYEDQKQYPDALREYQQNLALATDDEHTGYGALQCADMLWRLGRYAEASAMHERADAKAQNFRLLRVSITRSRAEMMLSQGRYTEAIALCRRVLASSPDHIEASIATRILGLAQVAGGARREGLRACEKAEAMAAKLGDFSIQVPSRLAVAEARLENGDADGALSGIHDILPALASLPDSRWRALALAARAAGPKARDYAAAAKQQLDAITSQWGPSAFDLYIKRPDSQKLLRRISHLFPGDHK